MRTTQAVAATLILAVLFAGLAWAQPVPQPTPTPVILVLLYGVSWSDLLAPDNEALWVMARQGAVGLLCTRTAARTPNHESAVLTLAAGARVTCELTGEGAGLALCVGEALHGRLAADVLKARTGYALGEGQVAYLGSAAVLHENADEAATLRLGQLGQALHLAQTRGAVLGTADLPPFYPLHRYAAAVAMDARGVVSRGDMRVQQCLLPDAGPLGVATNYDYLLSQVVALAGECSLIVVETGDCDRLARLAPALPDRVVATARAQALRRLDRFLAQLMPEAARRGWRIMLVSSGADNGESNVLQPALLWGRGVPPGLLGSPSTRSPWLGTTLDVVPTLLDLLGLEPLAPMTGRPLAAQSAPRHLRTILDLEQATARAEATRPVVAKIIVVLLILLLALGAGGLLLPGIAGPWRRGAAFCLLMAGSFPLAAMVWPVGMRWSAATIAMAVALTAALLAGMSWRLRRRGPGTLVAVIAGAVLLDMLWGSPLMSASALGYSLTAGARFYGLGNEFGGVLLGSMVLVACSLAGARGGWRIYLGAALLLVVALLAAMGGGGANFGIGAALAVAGIALLWLGLRRRRGVVVAVTVLVLGAGLMLLLARDVQSADGSHIGRMASLLLAGERDEAVVMAVRKLTMNWTLMRFSDWLYVLIAAAIALAAGPLARPAAWRGYVRSRPGMALAAGVLPVAALAAFALNDSGVLAAALALVMGAAALGCGQLQEQDKAGPPGGEDAGSRLSGAAEAV